MGTLSGRSSIPELTPRQFAAWVRTHHLTTAQAAELLGMSGRNIIVWSTGERGQVLPWYVGAVLYYLEREVLPRRAVSTSTQGGAAVGSCGAAWTEIPSDTNAKDDE